jgi:hypothetical protein
VTPPAHVPAHATLDDLDGRGRSAYLPAPETAGKGPGVGRPVEDAMAERLSGEALAALVRRVFRPGPADRRLAFLVDLPDGATPDHAAWRDRREMAAEWAEGLRAHAAAAGLDAVDLVLYRNVRANNADLPESGVLHPGGPLPADAEAMRGEPIRFDALFDSCTLLIAPTEFSVTAPLKMAAKPRRFRAATMPGFARSMIPALRLDYGVIGARCRRLKELLDRAEACDVVFEADGRERRLTLDLRHRTAHESGEVFPENGAAGNLPSGESYIVPYEGEIEGDPSRTQGEIPVQFGAEVVTYRVERNRAVAVTSRGPASEAEARKLVEEPAYGNLAELGLGVLGDMGIAPSGEILLDEKLGMHIAFGRSEHFGGQVGPKQFSAPDRVVHIDRVYTREIQPRVRVVRAVLRFGDGVEAELMRDGAYAIGLDGPA